MIRLMLNADPKIDDLFMEWLLFQFKLGCYQSVNKKKLKIMTRYANDNKLFYKMNPKAEDINVLKAFYMSLDNLRYRKIGKRYCIELNSNVKYPGYNIPIERICRYITYGTLDMPGYQIYTDTFKFINGNINMLYNRYIEELLYGG